MNTLQNVLIGDIGGTNARLALSTGAGPGYTSAETLEAAEFATVESAISAYLESTGKSSIRGICLAIAGPVTDDVVQITNGHWTISVESLETTFSASPVVLLNDFEAVAWAIPHLPHDGSVLVGEAHKVLPENDDFSVAIVGPGTGLGTSALSRRRGIFFAQAAEGGRVGFSPDSKLQFELSVILHEKFGRVAAERILSGPGIENLDWALAEINGHAYRPRTSAELFAAAENGSDLAAAETVQHFFEILGQYAGDYVLTTGAFDGLYLGGGIVPRYPKLLQNSKFRNGFENKGKYRSLMEQIPVRLITHAHPGLLGASARALS